MTPEHNNDPVGHISRLIVENKDLVQQLKELQDTHDSSLREIERLKNELKHLKDKAANDKLHAGEDQYMRFKMVTVAFIDIQGFSKVYEENNSHNIIDELDRIFFEFDVATKRHNIKHTRTIGDFYMCAGGIPVKNITNPIDVVLAALEMRYYVYQTQSNRKQIWDTHIGLHTGPVSANATGTKNISYSIKGDAVNIAHRMQAASSKGEIIISVMTYELVKEYFECEYRGLMPVKYQGDVEMYELKGLKPRFALDNTFVFPNDKFKTKYLLRQFSDLQEIVLDKLEKELPSCLHYHNVRHTIDVVSQVELIGIGEGVGENELLLLKTAGLFHDAGHVTGYDNHEILGTQIARQMLPEFKYTKEQIEKICTLIMATKLPPQPQTLLEKIMCDADLDYLGRTDFIPVSNTLYEELREQNKIDSKNEWNKMQIKFISGHQYFTDTANRLREVKKQMQIERLKNIIE